MNKKKRKKVWGKRKSERKKRTKLSKLGHMGINGPKVEWD
jgi:hypothetical protein